LVHKKCFGYQESKDFSPGKLDRFGVFIEALRYGDLVVVLDFTRFDSYDCKYSFSTFAFMERWSCFLGSERGKT
jgi:hypothetical protein